MTSGQITIEPNEGENYEGRQWGYTILRGNVPYLQAWTGGTGTCWNFSPYVNGEVAEDQIHVCELDDMIAVLEALRDSDAHAEHVKRWS